MGVTSQAPTVAIIGTGFGGIGMAIRLKQAGIQSFAIYSRASEVGGVWWENSYPGAACDVPSSLYSYSFEKNYDWSCSHGTQPEIAAYLRACVEKYGIGPHIRFNTEIVSAAFDPAQALWRLRAADGRRFEAQALVSACGLFNKPAYPEIEGADDFGGAIFHSARWDHGVDLTGKRVAVIGTGCSAAQFVPEIVGRVAKLVAFIRTPQYIVPKLEKVYSGEERETYRRYPALRALERIRTYIAFEKMYRIQVDEAVRREREQAALAFLESQVTDPEKRRLLTPTYRLGCKRTIQSNTYLRALDRPNVEIVRDRIARITPEGILTADGRHHPLDVIIYGTGFKPTDYLTPLRITGLDGRTLEEAWREGAEAYLGMTVSGFPNFFMIYGPNTNTANSILVMIEGQIGYILRSLRRMQQRGARAMNVRPDVQARFNDELQRILGRTVWGSGCDSYFRTETGRVVTQWPKPSRAYRWLTRKVNPADFSFTA